MFGFVHAVSAGFCAALASTCAKLAMSPELQRKFWNNFLLQSVFGGSTLTSLCRTVSPFISLFYMSCASSYLSKIVVIEEDAYAEGLITQQSLLNWNSPTASTRTNGITRSLLASYVPNTDSQSMDYPRAWFSYAADIRVEYSWVEFNFNVAGKLVVVGDENILCEHHLWMQRTPVRRFDPYLQVKWLKIAQFDLYFAQIWVRWRSIADALGTNWDRSPSVVSCNRRLRCR